VEKGNTEMKHSNQDNFRLMQSARIAPRMHQHAPFSTQVKKKFWETPPPVEGGTPTPSVPVFGIQPLLPQHDIPDLPLRNRGKVGEGRGKKRVEDPPMSEVR